MPIPSYVWIGTGRQLRHSNIKVFGLPSLCGARRGIYASSVKKTNKMRQSFVRENLTLVKNYRQLIH